MAMHHMRRKQALSLIGEEKDQGQIISLLKEKEFTDDEIMEVLQTQETPAEVPKDKEREQPAPKGSKYADFDVFLASAIVKEYRHIGGETRTYISHFQLQQKVQTVRIEPALAKDFNRHALGYVDTPGKMYFPAGEKKNGDIQTYNDPTYKPLNETLVTNEFM